MKIALNEKRRLLATLDGGLLRLFDVAGGAAKLAATRPLADGHCLAACDDYLAVLTGELGPAGRAVTGATLARFGWGLEPTDAPGVGMIELEGVALSPDGKRVALADWGTSKLVIADASTGAPVASKGGGIPSGPAWSPDGRRVLVGFADQGSGAIVLVDAAGANADGEPSALTLPEGRPSPGLDDAPYFSAFAAGGRLAAVSNESWGGRGVFVFDVEAGRPVWSVILDASSEDSEEFFAFAVAFANDDATLLVQSPGSIRAYRADDGRDLGAVDVPGDGRAGFVVERAARRIWAGGEVPVAYAFAAGWA